MKSIVWLLTGIGIGVATFVLLNQPSSSFATGSDDVEDAAGQTSLWGSKQRVRGAGSSLLGKAKQGIGNATGNDELAGEGLLDQAAGAVQDTAGKAAHAVSDTLHDLNR